MATGTGARQTAPAFHESFSLRGAPPIGGTSDAVLQIGNSDRSIAGAVTPNGSACAPKTPSGAASAAAAPERNSARRSSTGLPGCFSFDILLSPLRQARDHARATREAR